MHIKMSNLGAKASIFLILTFSTFLLTPASGKGIPIAVTEDNWNQVLKGEWMVEFYASWCPSCKSLQPTWESFAEWSDDLEIKVGQVDVTENPGLSGRFLVTALPTIFHIKDGIFRTYKGSRDKNDFISFIEDRKWESIEQIASWKSPDSIPMSAISYFFRLSMFMRSVHNAMIEEYGIPYWASYIIFALGTIVVGAILGLILVCFIDYFYPHQDAKELNDAKAAMPIIQDEDDLADDTLPQPNGAPGSRSESEDELSQQDGTQSEDEESKDASQSQEEASQSQEDEEEDKENKASGDLPAKKEVRKRTNIRKDN